MEQLGRHAWADLADRMAELIIDGTMPPGKHLVEVDVAEQFGISRGPVRTALAWLERQGLAEPQGRRGLAVVEMDAHDVDELFEVRIALETTALRSIIARIGTVDLAVLGERVARLEAVSSASGAKVIDMARADVEFHRSVCVLSDNSRLLRAWDELSYQILLVLGTLQGGDLEPVAHVFGHHKQIFDALTSKKPGKAEDLLVAHLQESHSLMVRATAERSHA